MQGELTNEEVRAEYKRQLEALERIQKGTKTLNKKLAIARIDRDDCQRNIRYARSKSKSKAQKQARKIQRLGRK